MQKYLKAAQTCEITCKACVAKREEEQISKSLEQTKVSDGSADSADGELHECAACKKNLAAALFNKNQLRNKGPGKQRCIECVKSAVNAENAALAVKKDEEMVKLREETKKAGKGGGKSLAAACREAAGEGERVTGLKPIVLGRGGRGKWRRGGGAGRGVSAGRGRGTTK
ncbi:hypothetical protein TrVE_jg1673 [Triparma verrucosa]|uniref:Stc1 domain-containing protein n=1 Tax=Triparma verrucosa TaxID=1606542 RepID=A0A9W7FIJ8_9STRA|nr:hypothetical protein TrVE_jg1673 [Triparma verrucosa]